MGYGGKSPRSLCINGSQIFAMKHLGGSNMSDDNRSHNEAVFFVAGIGIFLLGGFIVASGGPYWIGLAALIAAIWVGCGGKM